VRRRCTAPGNRRSRPSCSRSLLRWRWRPGSRLRPSAIAQLGQLDNRGRERFGRTTLWLTFAIEGSLTIALAMLAVHLRIGIPPPDSTLIADIASASVGRGAWFAVFQFASALLLLAAAASSFQAGPGLLKALARRVSRSGEPVGILHSALGKTNTHHTPYWSVLVYLVASTAVVVAAGGRDQELVLYYARRSLRQLPLWAAGDDVLLPTRGQPLAGDRETCSEPGLSPSRSSSTFVAAIRSPHSGRRSASADCSPGCGPDKAGPEGSRKWNERWKQSSARSARQRAHLDHLISPSARAPAAGTTGPPMHAGRR
jgi:hypothetical protein